MDQFVLQEVPAVGRRFTALTQTEMQLAVKSWLQESRSDIPVLAEGMSIRRDALEQLDYWIINNLNDREQRLNFVDALVAHAEPFAYQAAKKLSSIGSIASESVE